MDYERLVALLEERRILRLWDELWPDTNEGDGQLARQIRMQEIEDQILALIARSGQA